jgi:hypothetical protein
MLKAVFWSIFLFDPVDIVRWVFWKEYSGDAAFVAGISSFAYYNSALGACHKVARCCKGFLLALITDMWVLAVEEH